MDQPIPKTEAEWREKLTPEQYHVMREKGTEAPFTGEYFVTKDKGVYRCSVCGNALFASDTKFDSGTGWPSFDAPVDPARVQYHEDMSQGVRRVEVTCGRCGAHLGHMFDDGPTSTKKRFCINSVCLKLEKTASETTS
ncbi:MAG: peptide-methionine (R)-S-oxide reductase MsrB [Candidatus Uhrbacteria bacterium]|nr:peptide-methionine (R)-S-oxide reductase MsrB [Candidatus Uhrbacteria bacterium]